MQSTSTNSQILTAVVLQENKAFVYLLNKSDNTEDIYIELQGYKILDVIHAVSFKEPGIFEEISMSKINDHYETSISVNSLTMIELSIEK